METLGSSVLYYDTDSIIYEHGVNGPPLGNFVGEFTDELDGDVITSFVSGGPKNYGNRTANGKICCKVRGFTLKFKNAQLINFESLNTIVASFDEEESSIVVHNKRKITRDAKGRKFINRPETKVYRMVCKRVVKENFITVPYEY